MPQALMRRMLHDLLGLEAVPVRSHGPSAGGGARVLVATCSGSPRRRGPTPRPEVGGPRQTSKLGPIPLLMTGPHLRPDSHIN